MAQTIKLKRSALQGAIPSTSSLELGEVAINTYDGKMYIKKDDGTPAVVEIGGGAISNVVEDTTPQLGGDLYNNGNNIIVSNGNINLQDPAGSGASPGTFYGATALFGNDTGVVGYVQVGGNTSDNGTLAVNGTVVFNANTIINSIVYPDTDGTNGQILTTDGSGNLSFTTPSSGISNLVEDTTPQLGGTLDTNGNEIHVRAGAGSTFPGSMRFYEVQGYGSGYVGIRAPFSITDADSWYLTLPDNAGSSGQVLTVGSGGDTSWTTISSGGISNLVEDTTPQLGGTLDANNNNITNIGADGYSLPTADGTNGQVLTTDGAGTLSFTTPASGGTDVYLVDGGSATAIYTNGDLILDGGNA